MNITEQTEAIKREAIAAAEGGKGPDACPYLPKSAAAGTWKDAFYARLALLLPPFGRLA